MHIYIMYIAYYSYKSYCQCWRHFIAFVIGKWGYDVPEVRFYLNILQVFKPETKINNIMNLKDFFLPCSRVGRGRKNTYRMWPFLCFVWRLKHSCAFDTTMFPTLKLQWKLHIPHSLTLQRGVTGTARMLHALTHSSISRQVREQM